MLSFLVGRALLLSALLQSGQEIPPPRGLVNDFANVIPAASAARLERIAQDVRDKSKGEIAIVTLAGVPGLDVSTIALRIGRQWKVGNLAAIGDRSRNAGTVILLVPKETATDGRGGCRIEAGQGGEGFITDATAGDICREATPAFAQRDYATGLELVTTRVAQRYAQEFGFTLDTSIAAPAMPAGRSQARRGTGSGGGGGINPFLIVLGVVILISILGGGRRGGRGGCGCLPGLLPLLGGLANVSGRSGGFRGGGGGFGGGGGGGFGGFGGGGGFSGGGGGSNW